MALSVTEAELYAALVVAQYMIYVMHLMESIGLQVDNPITLEIDNEGCIDLIHKWSVAGRTRHVDIRKCFMSDMKEENIIVCKQIKGEQNRSDMFTKNLGSETYKRHVIEYVREDEYM